MDEGGVFMPNIFKTGILNRIKYIEMCGPTAVAHIKGSYKYPDIQGVVEFFPYLNGVYVVWEITGLPSQSGDFSIHGFHIHSGSSCGGSGREAFPESGTHYDTGSHAHPYHSGDLPPIFANNGYALGSVYTARVTPEEIMGRTVIIHSMPDDFTTQPAGDSGEKVACGVIEKF